MDELAALLEEAAAHPDRPECGRLIMAVLSLPLPLQRPTLSFPDVIGELGINASRYIADQIERCDVEPR